jgi:hypothetical protein
MKNGQTGEIVSIEKRFGRRAREPLADSSAPSISSESRELTVKVTAILARFSQWLDSYGETSWDHQSFFAGPVGGNAKALYYRYGKIGTFAVAPMGFPAIGAAPLSSSDPFSYR